jgi:hypothetical protein
MKINFIIVLSFVLISSSISQKTIYSSGTDLSRLDFNNKIWSESEVYNFAKKFFIQDSFFVNPNSIKDEFRFLCYLPQPDLDNYIKARGENWKSALELKSYKSELINISKIDDWVRLIQQYPTVGRMFILASDIGNGSVSGLNEFIRKLKDREMLMFIESNGSTVIVKNTRHNYIQYKHLTRLK